MDEKSLYPLVTAITPQILGRGTFMMVSIPPVQILGDMFRLFHRDQHPRSQSKWLS